MANIPPLKVLPSAFAQSAVNAYKNVIAAIRGVSTPENAATYEDGFGPATFRPVSADNPGLPPRGGDVNGILNDLSTPIYRAQMGIPINTWDASISQQGYPRGAIVWYSSNNVSPVQVISLVENNTQVPFNGENINSQYWQIVNLPKRYIVDTNTVNANNWWEKYNDGWCRQGFIVPIVKGLNSSYLTTIIGRPFTATFNPSYFGYGDDNDFGISVFAEAYKVSYNVYNQWDLKQNSKQQGYIVVEGYMQ